MECTYTRAYCLVYTDKYPHITIPSIRHIVFSTISKNNEQFDRLNTFQKKQHGILANSPADKSDILVNSPAGKPNNSKLRKHLSTLNTIKESEDETNENLDNRQNNNKPIIKLRTRSFPPMDTIYEDPSEEPINNQLCQEDNIENLFYE